MASPFLPPHANRGEVLPVHNTLVATATGGSHASWVQPMTATSYAMQKTHSVQSTGAHTSLQTSGFQVLSSVTVAIGPNRFLFAT